MVKREIEIQRNIIENFLMELKNFVKGNRKVFMYSLISLGAAAILAVSGVILYERKASQDLMQYEKIMENYLSIKESDPQKKSEKLLKTVAELNRLVDSSYWGYVNRVGYYVIGSLFFTEKKYKEATEYYLKFVEKSPSSFFAPMALLQAARAEEIIGNNESAFSLYQRLEKEYGESEVAARIYYDLARIHWKKGDLFKARDYYNRVITLYPQSLFAENAKRYLFLLGLKPGEVKKQ